jgi:uncharacterized membrane protein
MATETETKDTLKKITIFVVQKFAPHRGDIVENLMSDVPTMVVSARYSINNRAEALAAHFYAISQQTGEQFEKGARKLRRMVLVNTLALLYRDDINYERMDSKKTVAAIQAASVKFATGKIDEKAYRALLRVA